MAAKASKSSGSHAKNPGRRKAAKYKSVYPIHVTRNKNWNVRKHNGFESRDELVNHQMAVEEERYGKRR